MKQKIVTFSNSSQVLALGQGTWNMGRAHAKKAEELKALRCGIDLGMRVIDTAEMYDNEEMIGEAINGLRQKVFLISKVLPSNASISGTIQSCERSLKKLKTDYLDLYLLHWRGSYPLEDTVTAMQQLVRAGKIKMWGSAIWMFPKWKNSLPYLMAILVLPIRWHTICKQEASSTIFFRGIVKRICLLLHILPLGKENL